MKAIYTKPSRIIEYAGELHEIDETKIEVEILQFVKSFWVTIAVCRVGNIFKEIPLKDLEYEGSLSLNLFR